MEEATASLDQSEDIEEEVEVEVNKILEQVTAGNFFVCSAKDFLHTILGVLSQGKNAPTTLLAAPKKSNISEEQEERELAEMRSKLLSLK